MGVHQQEPVTKETVDVILKKELKQVINWKQVDKNDYLLAMERSPIRDIEIKHVLKAAMTEISVDGLTGEAMSWDADGAVNKAPKAMQIIDGNYSLIQ